MLAYMELIYYICDMGIEKIRKVIYTDEFMDYYWSLDAKLREKYSYIVNIIETQKVVNEKFVKKLVGTPYYEARVSFGSNEYRSVIFTIDKESFVESMWASISNSWATTGLKVASAVINMRTNSMTAKMDANYHELEGRVADSEEELAKLYDKELSIGLEDIKWYTSPITMDKLQFETDYLYEGTKFNIGRPSFFKATGLNIISDDVYKV
jgi:hypothetical protein